MALRRLNRTRFKQQVFISGYFYSFKYTNYENDPYPIIIFINAIKGVNKSTGHEWNLIQGINLNYVPRRDRKKFADLWMKEMERTNNAKLTWEKVKTRYPYIKHGIRRYLLKPSSYIHNPKTINFEDVQNAVVKSWGKDFSHTLRRKTLSKIKKLKRRKKKK